MKKFVIPIVTAAALTACSAPVEKSPEAVYEEFLYGIADDETYADCDMFDLYDTDSDNIPELFISEGDYHMGGVRIYTVRDGEAVCISDNSHGSFGTVLISGEYICSGYTAQGISVTDFFTKSEDKLIIAESFYDNEGGVDPDGEIPVVYKIGGEEVSRDDYEKTYEKYMTADPLSVGRRYELNEQGIKEAFGK